MIRTNSSIIATNLPLLLTNAEMDVPQEVIAEFFKTFDLDEIRQKISDISDIAVCAPREQLRGADRYDLLFIKRELIRVLEAVFLHYLSSRQ